ncbi:MAG: 5-(carboxyamino)imidazole ribonucleotide mutase [Bacteroidetes bacterium]|jgi:5-(carboxyamino)imidazole ribonucleotide mutase|nr:5-(carboxyamino)imidazole ribonucleotide mutase [Bacteroidota bacterium]MBT5531046.1 5-(carboxyamino)imidazole ribonucleotide mutase [Cytophagia bacterium]MBT3801074.1 5-(carboxyamino)imidazole ribonucleotide mutase [Bacteroidota bacterium]MBT4970082.1 5-(carboxyamino)imidazole ribonucleotide mutase [Bacteroidota bacterium]MBT5990724.1 5-(carboxyamino)imidazole ribonucleotide mutase [Bacteroidota bacterium]
MEKALVAIIMGSDSDLKVMQESAKVMEEFDIPYYIDVISAHRTPHQALEFSKNAHINGIKVIIAAAGMAAHLAGSLAAHTPLPVIGVPIAGGKLQGKDSLYSTVMMPPGVPVATVGIDGARNAGLLAVQILGTGDAAMMEKMMQFKRDQEKKVVARSEKLKSLGYKAYLEG